ncbi:peptidyl-tRNA hydrolase [Delitschia confertaspora ATCC 74209]|uniref:peptidyl-tRNA hydrolase n=1 Tax=Delitschia confertaspora ATCC 74209 TaxID=1513339 RepID=A0A9P4JWV2_9PLEO|nr:peptidyl-tRNA hydrolase [Delitschia confertaspora ATCC 74209]
MPPTHPLFIASIGNPTAAYANTLHSTGHRVLQTLHSRLSRATHMYPFAVDRRLANGLTASPDARILDYHIIRGFTRVHRSEAGAPPVFDWTLWQSPVLMNVSGRALAQAWKTWSAGKKDQAPRLVVLHDELEAPLGELKVKKQDASPRGHNGLKSIQQFMPGEEYWRIGIGIGRPESREPSEVARYVLRRMTYREETVLDRSADQVFKVCRDIYDGSR